MAAMLTAARRRPTGTPPTWGSYSLQGGGSADADQANAPSTPELSALEALDLLDVAAEQEQDVQGRRLERNRSRDPVVEKNW